VSGDAAALLAALAVGGRPLMPDDLGWVLEWRQNAFATRLASSSVAAS
jgi:hypothetical protein